MAGDVTEPIVSLDLEGRSGVINHTVTSDDDPAYDGLLAAGRAASMSPTRADRRDRRRAVGRRHHGGSRAGAAWDDSYTIRLASVPAGSAPVYVNVSAARTTQEEEDGTPAGDSLLISADGIHFSRYLTLTLTDTSAATIYVKAVDDTRIEGERIYAISHSSQSADSTFNHVAIKNVRVTVVDNDKPEVIVRGTGHADQVLEGNATTGITDTYTVQLGREITSGTVTVSIETNGQVAVSSLDSRFDAATNTLTFDSTNWNDAVLMTVAAVDDAVAENAMVSGIQHTATGGYASARFDVQVVDNDSAGLLIDQSGGTTLVVADDLATAGDEATTDTYTVRLTKEPAGDVTVQMVPDGLTTTSPSTLTFTVDNWWIAQTVTVSAAEPQPALPEQPLKTFAIQPHVVNTIAGPLFIEGYVDATADRSIKMAIMLPGETDVALPVIGGSVSEDTLVDTLNVHNDSSASDDIGVMDRGLWFDGDAATSTNISGLGLSGDVTFSTDYFPDGAKTFAGGITYRNVEVAEVLLGQGDDSFTIHDTLTTTADHGGITVVHGGGNTSATAGDTLTVTASRSAAGALRRYVAGRQPLRRHLGRGFA